MRDVWRPDNPGTKRARTERTRRRGRGWKRRSPHFGAWERVPLSTAPSESWHRSHIRAAHNGILLRDDSPRSRPALGSIIRAFKAASTCAIRLDGVPSFAWQFDYFEHVRRAVSSCSPGVGRRALRNSFVRTLIDNMPVGTAIMLARHIDGRLGG